MTIEIKSEVPLAPFADPIDVMVSFPSDLRVDWLERQDVLYLAAYVAMQAIRSLGGYSDHYYRTQLSEPIEVKVACPSGIAAKLQKADRKELIDLAAIVAAQAIESLGRFSEHRRAKPH